VLDAVGALFYAWQTVEDKEIVMTVSRIILMIGAAAILSACASSGKPLVYKHPETKSIVLLQGDTLQCEPLFRKAGFKRVDTGEIEN